MKNGEGTWGKEEGMQRWRLGEVGEEVGVRYAEMVARGGGRTEAGEDMQGLWREEVEEEGRGRHARIAPGGG